MKREDPLSTYLVATAELDDRDGRQYEKESQDTATKQPSISEEERHKIVNDILKDILLDAEETTPNTIAKDPPVSTDAPQSLPNNVQQIAVVGLAVTLLIVTLVYVIVKGLRSRKGRIGLGLSMVLIILSAGFWFLNYQAQEEQDRISKVWSTAFEDPSIQGFESCVERKAGSSASEHYRKKMVIECGEIAKAIEQGMGAR